MRSFTFKQVGYLGSNTSNLSNTPSKSFFKPLIAVSLTLSLSTLNAQNTDATATYEYKNGASGNNSSSSTCNAQSFPCSDNVFTSDNEKNGQVLGYLAGFTNKNKDAKELNIKLENGAFLKLDSLGTQAHGNLPIAIYVDNSGSNAKTFTLTSNNSTFIGNIRFYGNNSSTSSTGSNNGSTFKLTYMGNNTTDLSGKNIDKSQISVKSSDKLTGSYAQVGSIFNHSNSKVEATFSNGAKMYGDIYTATTAKAITVITFGETTSTTAGTANNNYNANDVVFVGGLQSNNGSTTLTINKGSANLDSVTFGTFGILAQNNGSNTITLKDGSLTASTISANNKGTNTITIGEAPGTSSPGTSSPGTSSPSTKADQSTPNFKVTGNIANKNSTNNITINKGSAIIEGYVSSDSDGANATSNTIKVLESSLTIGTKENNVPGKSMGIISWANSTNTITVGDSGAASSNWTSKTTDFNASSSLNVNRIYAASSGSKNLITVDGDLTMQYIDTPNTDAPGDTPNPIISRDALGADILATQGGVNEVTILGTLTSKVYADGTKTTTNNEYKKLIISSYGAKVTEGMGVSDDKSSESKNIIRILGKGQDSTATAAAGQQAQATQAKDADVNLGIIASTAGSNQVTIQGDSTTVANRKDATIDLVYASNRDFLGSLERDNRSGTNNITINNRKTVNINNIITQGAGNNTITLAYSASQIQNDGAQSNIGVSHTSGTTKLVYRVSQDSSLKNIFTLNYQSGYEKYHDAYKTKNGSSLSNIATKLVTSNSSSNSSKTLDVTYKGLTIADMDTTESTLTSLKHTIEANSALITDTLAMINPTMTKTTGSAATPVKSELDMKDTSKIIFNGSTNQIYLKSLTLNASSAAQDLLRDTLALKNTTIDLANVAFYDDQAHVSQGAFKTLNINSLSSITGGNTLVRLRADGESADKVSVSNLSLSTAGTINVQIFLKDPNLVTHDFSKQDVVVFETQKSSSTGDSSNTNNLTLVSKEAKTGFAIYTLNIKKKDATATLDTNTNTKEQWVISGVSDVRADANAIDHTSAALALGLNIFLDNINSLNKRMGELRDNENNQGVWARIYSGRATNHMQHIPTISYYTNFQAGYDYAFNPSDAKNYLGAFIQYGYTASKSKGLNSPSLKILGFSANSNNIDIGIYNSYIANWGLYSDSIFKISTIINDINIESQNTSNTNVGVSLSQEVGYRYKFGNKKEWYVDPQAEFTLGYINQSDIARIDNYGLILDGKLAASLLFRSRVAAHLGYSLETEKAGTYDFRLGLGYVYDVLANGGANFKINSLNYDKTIDALQNDGRMILNLGTNIRLADNHRIYFDFERSFFGKITTDYLVNIGYRYSFGAKANSEVKTQQISQEIKLKEAAPSSGYYIKALDSKKPSKKEMRILSQIDGIKTQNIGITKSYLIGPFRSIDEAKGEVNNYEGVLKELKSEGEIIEIE